MTDNSQLVFSISDLAKALNRSENSIRYSEQSHTIPLAARTESNQRVYSLRDMMHLQLILNQTVDMKSLAEVLQEKGYKNTKQIDKMLNQVLSELTAGQEH